MGSFIAKEERREKKNRVRIKLGRSSRTTLVQLERKRKRVRKRMRIIDILATIASYIYVRVHNRKLKRVIGRQ